MTQRPTQEGTALVEFQVVALLALLPMVLGILQMTLLLCGFHVLSFAAAEAARAGSIDHARIGGMYEALADGLTPLVTDLAEAAADGGSLTSFVSARVNARREVLQFASIERMAPSAADFADHGRDERGQRAIPNDALEHRPSAVGSRGGLSLQQANLLRIRVRYCHALVVPLVDRLLPALLRVLDPDPGNQRCYLAGRVPLRVATSAPMQSEAWQ